METLYDILIGDKPVKTPIAIASMAGITDGNYIKQRAEHIGIGFIGGYAIDEKTIQAAQAIKKSGRDEFLPRNPIDEIQKQVRIIEEAGVLAGVNIRTSSVDALIELTKEIGNSVIYEIDAHCRQQPMIDAGCGEFLLTHPERLISYVQTLKIAGVLVSVKIRAGVAADDAELARKLWKAGADIIHLDLMDFGVEKLRSIRNASPVTIIANNSITSFERAKDLFAHGADMVSLARGSSIENLAQLDTEIAQFTREHGWYNSPKQLCRGGDIRSLAFCCMPVKPCPLLPFLEKYKISPQEYVKIKMDGVKGTVIEQGANTCFGSLAYCCKDTTPCMFRDMALKQNGIKKSAFMLQKRDLSRKLVKAFFS